MATFHAQPCICANFARYGRDLSRHGLHYSPSSSQGYFSMAIVAQHHHYTSQKSFKASGVPDFGRRTAISLTLFTFTEFTEALCQRIAFADDERKTPNLNLESYSDEKQGFTLMKPAEWKKIDKAGATVLFEDPDSKGNNIGVVVNPVRINSLTDFGTIDEVADKLLQAERKKGSTNDVQLIKVNERMLRGGIPLYLLEYKLDSSRGVKRILSAVTVASKKLYVLNVAYKDSLETPLAPDTVSVLNQIVSSFDLLN